MEWSEIQRGLAVFAHPDDAEFGSAGTTAKMTREGKHFFYAVTTDGSKGSSNPDMTRDDMISLRHKEQQEAAHILGVEEVAFLDFEDSMLEANLAVRRSITAVIRRFKPDVVICQSPVRDLSMGAFVQHPDHLAAGEATLAAVYPCARDRLTFPDLLEQGLEPHAVKELWVVGTNAPDHYVDISETLDAKIQALKAHFSQIGERPVQDWMRDRARQLGERGGFEFAEAFKRIELPG
jgi:LmbE family N-acetylglucosaminyl deacetylase